LAGAANAQFASDRTAPAPFGGTAAPSVKAPPKPATPTVPSGLVPASYSTPTSPRPGQFTLPSGLPLPTADQDKLKPVPTSIQAEVAPHPWALRADMGEWMICVKSYTGPESRTQAEKLAQDLRQTHRVAGYVYERNGAERATELARIAAIRKSQNDKAQPFLNAMIQARKEAQATGMTFIEETAKIKVPLPYHETPEQWAVLIGPFATMDAASSSLPTVKKLDKPKDETLCDRELVGADIRDPKTGRMDWKSEWRPINPYSTAFVVRNPALTPTATLKEERRLDKFEVKLNENVKHCLLAVPKKFTVMVKAYTTPTRQLASGTGESVFKKAAGSSSTADILTGTMIEAENLCAALRDAGMKPRSYEAYVFHHRNGSIVTVGQFDTVDDPSLLELQRELQTITFAMSDKDKRPVLDSDGRATVQRLFDSVHPFPVPRQ